MYLEVWNRGFWPLNTILQVWTVEGSLKRVDLAQARFRQKIARASRLALSWSSLKRDSTAQHSFGIFMWFVGVVRGPLLAVFS